MTTQEVADRFSELNKEKNWNRIYDELYSQEAESIEPPHAVGLSHAKGMEAIREKGRAFSATIEQVHGGWSSEAVVGGNYFSVAMGMDVTMKGMGRMNLDEICVYEVKEGKIVKEQFFY